MNLAPVLCRFPPLFDSAAGAAVPPERLPVAPIAGGLINDTFALGQDHVLQRLHRIFRAEVNQDIAALVPCLRAGGVPVPELVAARDGRPFAEVSPAEDAAVAGVWRVLTRLPGRTLHKLAEPAQARSAGALVAHFHTALVGSEHAFAFTRPGAHDTDRHLAALAQAVDGHRQHRLYDAVAPLADELTSRWQAWGRPPALPDRVVHGDLKVSNLLFADDGSACGVLDLDTMARGGLDIELGDALRSWCNPAAEDAPTPRFDADLFDAAVEGWLSGAAPWVTDDELAALVPAVERICLELSARFAADALLETYFGWDPTRFPARGEHDLVRADNQLGLARDVARQRPALEARLEASVRQHR